MTDEEKRLREGLEAIRDQEASAPYPQLWTHWREIAERVLNGLPPHDPEKVGRYEWELVMERHREECRRANCCVNQRCTYSYHHFGPHSYQSHL